MNRKKLFIFGSGGFGNEIEMIIEQINQKKPSWEIIGFIDSDTTKKNQKTKSRRIILGDEKYLLNIREKVYVTLAIGNGKIREKIYKILKKNKFINFPNIIHPSVDTKKTSIKIGKGNMVLANSIISNNCEMGDFNIINFNSIIGHDVKIGSYNSISPQTSIAGMVKIENFCNLGIGCSIIEKLEIKSLTTIGGNSLMIRNSDSNNTYIGIPAKKMSMGKINTRHYHEKISVGVDIESIARFKEYSQNKKFLNKIFKKSEIKYCNKRGYPIQHLASRFCAKESIIKALGNQNIIIQYQDIEIKNKDNLAPEVILEKFKNVHVTISMSHSRENALSVAIATINKKNQGK